MALIFLGQSECPICGKLLMPDEELKALRGIPYPEHPLFHYFDAGMHLQCFENWDKKEEALTLVREEKQKFMNSEEFKAMVLKHGMPKWVEFDD